MENRNARLLDLYTDYLFVSFGQTTATGLAALIPDLSQDQVKRFLSQQELSNQDLWKIVKPHLRQIQSDDAVLILVDSVEEKPYTDPSELICTHFDPVTGRYIKGINLMSCLYFSQGRSLPVNFHLIQKTELVQDKKTGKDKWQSPRNKNEIAQEMIASAVNRQIPFRYVLNDIWFSSAENMVFIKGKKKDFVMPLKSNCKVALTESLKKQGQWQTISSLSFDTDAQYLVTSDLSLSAASMTTIYQKRWKVEEYHKSLKSNASFSKSPTKRVRTQSNHFFACLVAFVKLETYRLRTALNNFALKGKLYQAAIASAFRELQTLKVAYQWGAITS